MAAALTLTAAAAPAAIAGIKSGANVNGGNSAGYTYAGGTPGAGDTIANAQLIKGVSTTSRLYALLNTTFTDIGGGATAQEQLDAALAALGFIASVNGGSALRMVVASGAKPTATVTTAAATGSLRIALGASITA